MSNITTEKVRNIAICGHGGTGKTSLLEHLLYTAGAIESFGSVDSGKSISDFSDDEIEKRMSLYLSLSYLFWEKCKVNLFDTPGSGDFIGQVVPAFRASESALMVIDGEQGIEVETIKLWRRLDRRAMPRMVFVTKMDQPRADFFKIVDDLKEAFGKDVVPITMPMGSGSNYKGVISLLKMRAFAAGGDKREGGDTDIPKEYQEQAKALHEKLIEMAAEGDDSLMERYFNKGDLTLEEAIEGLREDLIDNRFVPIFCGVPTLNSGLVPLLNFFAFDAPSPMKIDEPCLIENESVSIQPKGSFSGLVFKTGIDKFTGKNSYLKVITGVLRSGTEVEDPTKKTKVRINKLFFCEGRNIKETSEICAGDIGLITKADEVETNDTLCASDRKALYKPLDLPEPIYSLTTATENQKDEDKLNQLLHRAAEEDLTFKVEFREETKQNVISGMGELHVNTVLNKIEKETKIAVKTDKPNVPYRETITKNVDSEYTHKKQTGGHGQYGRVVIKVFPLNRGDFFRMDNQIKGGVISKGYMPGIEKGLLEAMKEGHLACYPMVDIGVSVLDGKEHSVDSSEMAFKLAAKQALKQAFEKASPTLLEPIMNVTIYIDENNLGDVLSDLSTRRGKIVNQATVGKALQAIKAQLPQSETLRYAIDLKAMTSGKGAFEMEFSHYEPISGKKAEEVIKKKSV